VERVGAAEHGRERLERRLAMLFSICCAVSEHPRLGVEAELQRTLVLGAVLLAHVPRPDAPRGSIFGDLLEEVDVCVEEEGQARRKLVHVEAALDTSLHVGETVGERERQLLRRGAAGLANVISADRDRIPARHVARAELDNIVTSRIDGRMER